MAELLYLVLGLAGVVLGAQIAVDNVARIARRYGVSQFVLGVTILAIGSDLPELVVSLNAGVRNLLSQETSNLIVGNALGSGFGQLGMSMGVAAIIAPMVLPREWVLRHGVVLLLAMCLLFALAVDGAISRLDGALLTVSFLGYLFITLRSGFNGNTEGPSSGRIAYTWGLVGLGLTILVGGSDLVVRSAIELARVWQIDQALVGIAIVGFGTSLPELAVAIGAALKGHPELAIGNLIGSNVLDVLLPIGLAALIYPISFDSTLLWFDLLLLFGLTVLVLGWLVSRDGMGRAGGVLLVVLYLAYLAAKWIAG